MLDNVRLWVSIKTCVIVCAIILAVLFIIALIRFVSRVIEYNRLKKAILGVDMLKVSGTIVEKHRFKNLSGEDRYVLFLQGNNMFDYCDCIYVSGDTYDAYSTGDMYKE